MYKRGTNQLTLQNIQDFIKYPLILLNVPLLILHPKDFISWRNKVRRQIAGYYPVCSYENTPLDGNNEYIIKYREYHK